MLPGKKFSPSDLFEIARRRMWLLMIPPVVTLFAALLYSSRVPNAYQSDMLIAIDPQRVPDEFVQSTVTLGTDRRMEAISVQVRSRTNLERMITGLDLYAEERRRLPMEDVVAHMNDNIIVQLERPRAQEASQAFHVKFTHSDPNVAALVTQQLGALFVDQNVRDRGALAQATNAFLDTQLEETRTKLEEQERRLEVFRKTHGQSLPTQMQANMQALQNAQLQSQAMVESIARDKDRRQMLERLYRDPANDVAAQPAQAPQPQNTTELPLAASAQQRLATAKASLASLELRYRPDHPDVVRMKRLVVELEPKALAEAEAAKLALPGELPVVPVAPAEAARRERLSQMAAEIESLDRQTRFKESEEQRLRAVVAEYQRRIEAVPGLESEWSALTRDYETQQTAYRDLLSKSGNANIAAALEQQKIGEHFRIVDPAGIPVHPLPSLRPTINFAGLLIGLLLGIGVAALLELRDASFRNEGEILEILALPVLATVPRVEVASERVRRRRVTALLGAGAAVCAAGMGYATWVLKLWNSLL